MREWTMASVALREKLLRLIIITFITLTIPMQSCYSRHIYQKLNNPSGSDLPFEKMVIDKQTGRVYVGGVNWLYELTPELNIKHKVSTGPSQEDPLCSRSADTSNRCPNARSMNSHTKALAIHGDRSKLIECVSLSQGRCRLRNLYDIRSDNVRSSPSPMVANDAGNTTVVFVGPGPPNPDADSVLYVASTYTALGPFRDDVPAIASYSLDDQSSSSLSNPESRLFHLAAKQVRGVTKLELAKDKRESYLIDYVFGFSSGNFSYFLTRQRKTLGPSKYVSKLVRLCHADQFYHSYMEVELVCERKRPTTRGGDNHFNLVQDAFLATPGYDLANSLNIGTNELVLFAVFAQGANSTEERKEPTKHSALCAYSMKMIEQKFIENTEECHKGNMNKGLPWLGKDVEPCKKTAFPIDEVICGQQGGINSHLGGAIPIAASAVIVTNNAQFTSVTAKAEPRATAVFIGTNDGRIIKGVVESNSTGYIYKSLEIDPGWQILQDMDLDISSDFLVVATPTAITKVKVSECGEYSRCGQCLGARDPFCGWCPATSKCTIKQSCPTNKGGGGWLSYPGSQCASIEDVRPRQIEITHAREVELDVNNLQLTPLQPGQQQQTMSCNFVFNGDPDGGLVTDARLTEASTRTMKCPLPDNRLLPAIPDGLHSIDAVLMLEKDRGRGGAEVASTNVTFFNCATYSTCTRCVRSAFPCGWCVATNQCLTRVADKCIASGGLTIVNGINEKGASRSRGPQHCPSIEPRESGRNQVYVHDGDSHSVSVKGLNLDRLDYTDFVCEYKIQYSAETVSATWERSSNTIKCNPYTFRFYPESGNDGTAVAQLSVLYNDNRRRLDNVQQVEVVMYKCERLASNCGRCQQLQSQNYNCRWCITAALSSCTRKSQCQKQGFRWLSPNEFCPGLKILNFTPRKGPSNGGTRVNITGINLGRRFSDITADSVVFGIGNVKCAAIEELYVPSERIVCETLSSAVSQEGSGPIQITIGGHMTHSSGMEFEFRNPRIDTFSPVSGPQSGGTDVTIFGQHLDGGSTRTASFGNILCNITSFNSTQMVCRTAGSGRVKSAHFRLKVDKWEHEYQQQPFEFNKDPKILSVRPEHSIVSGGITIQVRGEGFNQIQRPVMVLNYRDSEFRSSRCVKLDDENLYCRTPSVEFSDTISGRRSKRASSLPTSDHPFVVEYGFILDGLVKRNLAQETNFKEFRIYPDPQIVPFTSPKFYEKQDGYLAIHGENIMLAAGEDDVRVTVGNQRCNLTAVAHNLITCQAPKEPPQPTTPGNALPDVVVHIGNAKYVVGDLSYDSQSGTLLDSNILVAVAIALVVFIVAIIVLLIMWRRNSTKHERQMKTLKAQMDTIEMKVATECKEAFAELQTSMSEMAAEMGLAHAIPFFSYREYAAQVLFPNAINHPVLRDLEVDPKRAVQIEKGLRLFNQLLMSKTFLLAFVRTMEGNKYFLSKDRVYVGSLIMVILQEKMEYCTDILKTLLADLIERTLERRLQPKILFRRSESIAERMLAAWFTFLMHRYLVECAGRPLFALYWAMKQQVEKGPQDSITHEARYSLSEEKLLRATVDFHEMSVYVSVDSGGGAGATRAPDVPVRVLDCDTITQVKEKCLDSLYRTTPASQRPSANDLDLELRTGASGRQILQDLDGTTRLEGGGWRRMNTLSHYKVQANSTVALVPRQASLYNLSLLSEKSSTFSLKNSPTLTRAFTAGASSKDPESGYKLYHIVKPNDHGPQQEQAGDKMVSEIYLTRLLTMKGTLQKFMEDLLEVIFSTAHRGSTFPLSIKYMFDYLDDQALQHGITDPEVVHTWKSNALPLRFWVNLVKNPHFLFDICRPTKIEGSLSVVAQTLMDACSTQDHQLTKDSPSSKLLFARDIANYRDWVDQYYHDIQRTPAISDQDMNAYLAEISRSHQRQFHIYSALNELYKYLFQYKDQLAQVLAEDEFANKSRLPSKFQQMLEVMDSTAEIYSAV